MMQAPQSPQLPKEMEMQVWFLAVAEKHKNLKHHILTFCLIIAEWQL